MVHWFICNKTCETPREFIQSNQHKFLLWQVCFEASRVASKGLCVIV